MKLVTFLRKGIDKLLQNDYWHGDRQVGVNFTQGKIAGYYNDLKAKTQKFDGPCSIDGVPLVDSGSSNDFVLHPVTVCQVALGWHERWIEEGSDFALERFMVLATWLLNNQTDFHGVEGVWPIPLAIPDYHLAAQWISALVQGQALSVLVRAYRASGDETYLNSAARALEPYSRDVANGGVRAVDEEGRVFFEEYPTEPSSFVLNGYISSLWGLYDYWLATNDPSINTIFRAGIETLIHYLPSFDIGYWSLYSLYPHRFPNVASPYYHNEHIAQLRATFMLTHRPELLEVANRWKLYRLRRLYLLRALVAKAQFKIGNWSRARWQFP